MRFLNLSSNEPGLETQTIRNLLLFLVRLFVFADGLFVFAAGLFLFSTAHGALLLEEPFNYSTGQLSQQAVPPWSTTAVQITIESGNLPAPSGLRMPVVAGNLLQLYTNTAAQVATRLFNNIPVTNGAVYISFLLRETLIPTTLGGAIIGLYDGGTLSYASGNASAALHLNVRRWTATSWQVGIRKGQGSTSAGDGVYWAAPINLGDTVFVVAKYQFDSEFSDTVTLWVNPPSASYGNSEPPPDVESTDDGVSADASGLRHLFVRTWGFGGNGISQIDNIRIGTSWADVAPTDAAPLIITSIQRLIPTDVKLVWQSTPGKSYVVESRDNLSTGDWTTNGTIAATESTTAFTNSGISSGVLQRFYRVGQTP